jgi:hypothetical protein
MGRRDRVVVIGIAFIVGYLGVVAWHGPERGTEAFPVFDWSLFSEIPEPSISDYSIRITTIDGQELATPLFFEEAKRYLPNAYQRSDAYQLIQRLGTAVERSQRGKVRELQAVLDERWLAEVGTAEYEVVRREFDLLERAQCDCYTDVTVLSRGAKG